MVFEKFFFDATCPPPPPPNKEQLKTEGAALMQAAGVKTCETSQSSFTAEAHGSISAPLGLGGADFGMSMTSNNSSSIGCEQIAVITDKYRKAVNSTTCLLKETKNVVKNSISGINSIVFDAGRDLDVNCNGQDGLTIKQKMSLDMISQINLSQAELTKIETACKDVVKTMAETAMSSQNGLGATPQGQKMIKDTLTDIQQNDYKASISKTLNETITTMQGSNTVLFKAGRDLKINGSRCVFEQDMLIKMVATSAVDSTLSDMMSNLSDTLNDTSVSTKQAAVNKGADDLAAAVKTPTPDRSLISTTTMIIIAVIVFIVILGGIITAVLMKKNSSPSASLRSYSRYSPKQNIDLKVVFAIILLIYFLMSKKEGFSEDKVYDF